MFQSCMNDINDVVQVKEFIKKLNTNRDFVKFRDYWLFESSLQERKLILDFTGFASVAAWYKRSSAAAVLNLPHFEAEFYDRADVIDSLPKDTKTVLSKINGRLLESENYRPVDIVFSNAMSIRLFKYMSRLGLYKPEQLVRLYKAGGLGNELRLDAETALANECVDTLYSEDTEIEFASNINDILNCVDESKYGYIRVATYVELPYDVAKKLGRSIRDKYEGNLDEIVDEMSETGKYSDDEIEFLYEFNKVGMDCRGKYNISTNRLNEIIRDMRIRTM